jgi:SAM-dependent methyltransferase
VQQHFVPSTDALAVNLSSASCLSNDDCEHEQCASARSTASSHHRDMTAPREYWFGPVARFLGPAYLRNAFTKGTAQEIDFLWDALELEPGQRVLDVGCGPGRHALELARRGIDVVGVDASDEFLTLARERAASERLEARFELLDVRHLAYAAEFDVAICLCQGGFGLLGGRDEVDVFSRIVRALRDGGRLAVSAFSSAFAVRFLEENETFDVATGVLHERATVRDAEGGEREFDLWTTCFTARELELLAAGSRIVVDAVHGVAPGRYRVASPDLEAPELLLLGRRDATDADAVSLR